MPRRWRETCNAIGVALLSTAAMFTARAQTSTAPDQLEEIQVTAERLGLMGSASTASEGLVVNDELALTPAFRVGQLLETVPGLQVTSHSGEGKANQYLLRGYNLDHGTDLAIFVDGMPVNEPTHAHGKGYTDLTFLTPLRKAISPRWDRCTSITSTRSLRRFPIPRGRLGTSASLAAARWASARASYWALWSGSTIKARGAIPESCTKSTRCYATARATKP